MPGHSVGMLPQEPALDEGTTVLGTIEEGVAGTKALIEQYNAIAGRMAAAAASRAKLDFAEIQIPPGPRLGSLVVEADHLVKGFGDRMLIDGLSFSLPPNGIAGVIGPNGIGKTTLLKMILGEEQPDAGQLGRHLVDVPPQHRRQVGVHHRGVAPGYQPHQRADLM